MPEWDKLTDFSRKYLPSNKANVNVVIELIHDHFLCGKEFPSIQYTVCLLNCFLQKYGGGGVWKIRCDGFI